MTRLLRLVISIIFIKCTSSLQNGPNNILSNAILNNSNGLPQGIIQKSLNQIASNRGLPINLQQTLNAQQPSNSQQNQNLPQTLNIQAPVSSQTGNTQTVNVQSSFEQSSNGKQTKGYRQPLIVQRPSSSPTTIYSPSDNNKQQNYNAEQQNLNLGNVQLFQQQAPGMMTSSFVAQNPTVSPQTYQGIASDPFSIQTLVGIPMSNINSISETSAVTCPQSQQPFAISGVPSYIIDRSQLSNCVQQPATTSTVSNQPLVPFYGVPQGQQMLDISQTEYPNQIIYQTVPPQQSVTSVNQQLFDNEINTLPSVANQSFTPNSLTSLLSSSILSSLSQTGSKQSGLKALLPLILNMMQERNNNNCDCCPHCGCNQNRNARQKGDVREGFPKQIRYGYKQEAPLKYNNDDSVVFENHKERERRTDDKKPARRYVKHEESYEDYDADDYDY